MFPNCTISVIKSDEILSTIKQLNDDSKGICKIMGKIQLVEDEKPVFVTARYVPYARENILTEEIKRLVKEITENP